MKKPSSETTARADEQRAAEAAKTSRLRTLRLAREAAERDAAPPAAPPLLARAKARPRRVNDAT
jgi:hypothetical protein